MNLDNQDDLVESLRELDATPAERVAWAPIVQRLTQWPDRRITSLDTQRLMSVLGQLMPQQSSVRQEVRDRLARRNPLVTLLATVHTQASVLRLTFWVLSMVIVLLGVVIELLPSQNAASVTWLRVLAPLLAYLSVASAFRGIGLHTLEWELACPPSALQLIVSRLVVVLGYDVGLGLILSLVGWARGDVSFLVVTLYWLMPLLLVAGLALVLSLWLPVALAAALAYSSWLAMLLLSSEHLGTLLSFRSELILGLAGLLLFAIALWRFTLHMPSHFLSAAT